MKHLWSPWRMPYMEQPNKNSGCLFCDCLEENDGPSNLILHRGQNAFVILNRYPYNNGHMMIVPYTHAPSIENLDADVLAELMLLTKQAVMILRQEYEADGYNVGINLGSAAGAGIAEHVHIHVLPRWEGDTNFMTTTADTRVLPEALDATYQRLRAAWQQTAKNQ